MSFLLGRFPVAVLLSSVVAGGMARAQCHRSFDAPRAVVTLGSPSVNDRPASIGVADFDGDGVPDLLASNEIFLGFARRVPLPLYLGSPSATRITDLNHDGRPDIVSVILLNGFNAASGVNIVALVNTGGGTFDRVDNTTSSIAQVPSFVWADFNGDGLLDFYTSGGYDGFTNSTPVFLGLADGRFRPERGTDAKDSGTAEGQWIGADLNGDGRSDLISARMTSSNKQEVSYYLRTANGFEKHAGPSPAGVPIVAADFNGSGRDEVIFDGITGLTDAKIYTDFIAGNSMPFSSPNAITADFNGDGLLDYAGRGFSAAIRLNDGHGNFRLAQEVPGAGFLLLAADADGDGVVDLVSTKGRDVFVLHGNGDGTFTVPHVTLPVATLALAADLDGDGDDDIVAANAVAWNNGDGTFRNVKIADDRFNPVRVADVDGDGKAEVITRTGNAVYVFSVRPDDTLADVATILVGAVDVAVGDFTGKHHPELVLLEGITRRLGIGVFEIRNGSIPRVFIPLVDPNTSSIAAADLNGDGADDIIVGGYEGIPAPPFITGVVSTFLSNGSTFGAEQRTKSSPTSVSAIRAGDFDGDGKTDLATLGGAPARVLYGDGKGGFPRFQDIAVAPGFGVNSVGVADFDGDHVSDLALNGAAMIFFGGPDGLVERGRYFGPQYTSTYVATVPLRMSRGALPMLVVPSPAGPEGFIYRPLCHRTRATR